MHHTGKGILLHAVSEAEVGIQVFDRGRAHRNLGWVEHGAMVTKFYTGARDFRRPSGNVAGIPEHNCTRREGKIYIVAYKAHLCPIFLC